jgi:hypothetical protein
MKQDSQRSHPIALRRAAVFVLLLIALPLSAQDSGDLQIFGSMQSIFMHQDSRMNATFADPSLDYKFSEARNTFAIQQLDFFFNKEIDESCTAFIDLEFQLNYSSENRWGSLSLQEAWLNYHYSDELNIKAGLLYPAFNHLNEIKNRLGLLPYVFRPLVYERLLSNRFLTEDFVPEHAFLQIHGSHPTGGVFLDYALYAGNAESSYITTNNPDGTISTYINEGFEFLGGVDPTDLNLKLFGGRIGVRTRDEQWKAGLSVTHDYNNLRDTLRMGYYVLPQESRQILGNDAARVRVGGDVGFRYGALSFEGEFIKVLYKYRPTEQRDMRAEQGFAYGYLGYDVLSAVTVYGSLQWGDYFFGVDAAYFVYTMGGAVRLNNSITAKAQFIVYDELHESVLLEGTGTPIHDQRVTINFAFLGISVLL